MVKLCFLNISERITYKATQPLDSTSLVLDFDYPSQSRHKLPWFLSAAMEAPKCENYD